mgnify:CR=1 FL=1
MKKIIIGIMGPGEGATPTDCQNAYEIGRLIAQAGWVILTGGRNIGVMDAASKGAKSANGLTIGILPGIDDQNISEAVDIAIVTDMGNARNNINVLSSYVVVACGIGIGTASEIALALKVKKKVILLTNNQESKVFYQKLSPENIFIVENPIEIPAIIKKLIVL